MHGEVWNDEDGNYFGEGHIPGARFKEMCRAYDMKTLGEDHDPDYEGCGDMEPGEVEHIWNDDTASEEDERWHIQHSPSLLPRLAHLFGVKHRVRPYTRWYR